MNKYFMVEKMIKAIPLPIALPINILKLPLF